MCNITLSDKCVKIGNNAFSTNTNKGIYTQPFHSLISRLPEKIEEIGDSAFEFTSILRRSEIIYEIPETLKYLGKNAFNQAYINIANIPSSITKILDYTFAHNYFEDLYLPENLQSIGYNAFAFCDFQTLIFPDSYLTLGQRAFYYCDINNIKLGKNISYFGYECFLQASISLSLEFPPSIKIIHEGSFKNCNYDNLIFHEGLEIIDKCAFMCDNIFIYEGNLIFPSSLK